MRESSDGGMDGHQRSGIVSSINPPFPCLAGKIIFRRKSSNLTSKLPVESLKLNTQLKAA